MGAVLRIRHVIGRVPAWLWILCGGAAAFLLVLLALRATDDVVLAPSLVLLGSTIVPATVLSYAASDGRRILAPPGLIAMVAVSGGVLGTAASGVLEHDAMHLSGAPSSVRVAVIEECAKMVVPLLVLATVRSRDPQYGVIVGVASAMGFASLETMGYAFQAFLTSHSLHSVEDTLLLRALTAPAGHLAWTGVTCAALWGVARAPAGTQWRHVMGAVGALGAAVLVHATWDSSRHVWVHLSVAWVSFGSLLLVIRAPRNRRTAT